MTEQTKKLSKTQLKRWKLALREAAKINRKLKRNKGSILIDCTDYSIINTKFELFNENGISTLGYKIDRALYSKGDNDKNFDNGIMYSSLGDIRRMFKNYKVYKKLNEIITNNNNYFNYFKCNSKCRSKVSSKFKEWYY